MQPVSGFAGSENHSITSTYQPDLKNSKAQGLANKQEQELYHRAKGGHEFGIL